MEIVFELFSKKDLLSSRVKVVTGITGNSSLSTFEFCVVNGDHMIAIYCDSSQENFNPNCSDRKLGIMR